MSLGQEIQYRAAAPALLIFLISVGAIGLFLRMSPAIEIIIRENDASLEAVEDMLAALAMRQSPEFEPAGRELYFEALSRAQNNITEPDETRILEEIQELSRRVWEESPDDQPALLSKLQELSDLNRTAMRRSDAAAKQLGTAGAWTAALLGFFGFFISLFSARRLTDRIFVPIYDMFETAMAFREGDKHRRCRSITDIPRELHILSSTLNNLLAHACDRNAGNEHLRSRSTEPDYQALSRLLLDEVSDPAAIVSESGDLLFANKTALERLLSEENTRLREALRNLQGDKSAEFVAAVHSFEGGALVFFEPFQAIRK